MGGSEGPRIQGGEKGGKTMITINMKKFNKRTNGE